MMRMFNAARGHHILGSFFALVVDASDLARSHSRKSSAVYAAARTSPSSMRIWKS